jgi:hypothetical protein
MPPPFALAELTNTIVAGNRGGDISGSFAGTNNLIGRNPMLAPLGNYGGPTQTMALLPGSPALNAGDLNQLGSPDQRGVVRTGGVNIGAYQASVSAFVLTAPDTVTAGMPFAVTVTAVDVFAQLAVGYTGTVTFSTTDPDPNVVLPPDYPFTLADQGRHTFLAGFTLVTAGDQTLTVTDISANAITGTVIATVDPSPSPPPGGGARQPSLAPIPRSSPYLLDSSVIHTTDFIPAVRMRTVEEVARVNRFFASLNNDDSWFPSLLSKHALRLRAAFSNAYRRQSVLASGRGGHAGTQGARGKLQVRGRCVARLAAAIPCTHVASADGRA